MWNGVLLCSAAIYRCNDGRSIYGAKSRIGCAPEKIRATSHGFPLSHCQSDNTAMISHLAVTVGRGGGPLLAIKRFKEHDRASDPAWFATTPSGCRSNFHCRCNLPWARTSSVERVCPNYGVNEFGGIMRLREMYLQKHVSELRWVWFDHGLRQY